MTGADELDALLDHAGLAVAIYNPDGYCCRYRFFTSESDYFESDGLYTALGRAQAVTWLRGFVTARSLGPVAA